MGAKQFCFRRYQFECFMSKVDVHCCFVVCFVVCELLRSIWNEFGEFLLDKIFDTSS